MRRLTKRHLLLFLPLVGIPSCAHVTVDPIEVKPIHIVADINIRVDRELDNFFSFENGADAKPATAPASN